MATERYRQEYLQTLKKEMDIQKDYLNDQVLSSLYLGGGTPSILSAGDINDILEAVDTHFKLAGDAEVTLEANPDDIHPAGVRAWMGAGINRVSLGVQSFFDEDLAYLNRVHSAADAVSAIRSLQDAGLVNLSIDLIYGIPTLDLARWEDNLRRFFHFDIPHLSAYALTVEERTALHSFIQKGKAEAPDDEAIATQFQSLAGMAEEHSYIHYEISNFATEGYYSRHNSLYWTGGHYLGLGPSAHSYNGETRRWNKASMKAWLALEDHYGESFEEEVLDTGQRFNEYVMTSIRTVWGCDIALVRQQFGPKYADHLIQASDTFVRNGNLKLSGSRLFLTNNGKLLADGITSALFC